MSSIAQEQLRTVGHRGTPGDYCWPVSVLNDAAFLTEFDNIVGKEAVEVFLPNSLNSLYYLCVGHPKVARISYLDEGRLTKLAIATKQKKFTNPIGFFLAPAFAATNRSPKKIRKSIFRTLAILVRWAIVQKYEIHTSSYPYKTLERRWKPGRILCHIPLETDLSNVETVNLLRDLEFPKNYERDACLFLHPKNIETPEKAEALAKLVSLHRASYETLLIKLHPIFSAHQNCKMAFLEKLEQRKIPWAYAEISGRQEVSIELYARGVRVFFLAPSTIEDTIQAFPEFFKSLKCITIG